MNLPYSCRSILDEVIRNEIDLPEIDFHYRGTELVVVAIRSSQRFSRTSSGMPSFEGRRSRSPYQGGGDDDAVLVSGRGYRTGIPTR